jgi:hypothetical protein
MPTIVGIRFRKACKIYYFDPVDTGVVKEATTLSWKQPGVWNLARWFWDRARWRTPIIR